ncbi:MAG: response regulator transcription factor [Caldilineaceae bacterium]|nr:response regulator transcription factor [Caldilineaceae bacterium]
MRANLQPVRVLIVDAHTVVRRGLRMLLDMQPDIQVVGEAGTVAEARRRLDELLPDVMLMDPALPDGDGVDLSARRSGTPPRAKILLISETYARPTVFRALDAGVHGYILKEVAPQELAAAIRQVAAGEAYLHPAIADMVRHRHVRQSTPSRLLDLTPRELEVLALMATATSNREIAEQLTLAEETVRSHVKSILRKLGAHSRTQAVVEALRLDLIQLHN